MIYRPQMADRVPEGYTAEPYDYYWDEQSVQLQFLNLPVATTPLTVGSQITSIPFQLDPDADWIWKATAVGFRAVGYTSQINAAWTTFLLRFRDPFGNYLSNDYEPLAWWVSDEPVDIDAGVAGTTNGYTDLFGSLSRARLWEPAIWCPAGSTILMDLAATSTAQNLGQNMPLFGAQGGAFSGLPAFPVYFRGYKLYPKGAKCQ